MSGRTWTRDEQLLALGLYYRLPFGQFHSRNPDVMSLARLLGRQPGAVAMKLVNFASLDPYHQMRGVSGLKNASQGDRKIWEEFHARWEDVALESNLALQRLRQSPPADETANILDETLFAPSVTEVEQLTRVRIGQQFFRSIVLASYGVRCCVCGMPVRDILIASHIIAWRDNASLRVDPHNGLCLCAIHDKAFDRGLMTISAKNYEVILGNELRERINEPSVERSFSIYQALPISLPERHPPNREYLEWHRTHYFHE